VSDGSLGAGLDIILAHDLVITLDHGLVASSGFFLVTSLVLGLDIITVFGFFIIFVIYLVLVVVVPDLDLCDFLGLTDTFLFVDLVPDFCVPLLAVILLCEL
jgi:hypothetical protein